MNACIQYGLIAPSKPRVGSTRISPSFATGIQAIRLSDLRLTADTVAVESDTTSAVFTLTRRKRRPAYGTAVAAVTATAIWLSDVFREIDAFTLRYAMITLTLGFAARWLFVKASPRTDDLTFLSPWIPVAALAFAVALSPLKTFLASGDADPAGTLARHYGLVAPGQQATAVDRCIARQLHNASQKPAAQPVTAPAGQGVGFYRSVCNTALLQSLLLVDGTAISRPQLTAIEQNTLAAYG
jgi:hypothetical protein